MRWWRSRRRGGAGLALLALAVQIVLSFGHLHLDDLRSVTAQAAASHSAPAQRQLPPGAPDDDCPICVAMLLAVSGVLAMPPAVAAPTDFNPVAHSAVATRQFSPARYVLFRTRAPPAA